MTPLMLHDLPGGTITEFAQSNAPLVVRIPATEYICDRDLNDFAIYACMEPPALATAIPSPWSADKDGASKENISVGATLPGLVANDGGGKAGTLGESQYPIKRAVRRNVFLQILNSRAQTIGCLFEVGVALFLKERRSWMPSWC